MKLETHGLTEQYYYTAKIKHLLNLTTTVNDQENLFKFANLPNKNIDHYSYLRVTIIVK